MFGLHFISISSNIMSWSVRPALNATNFKLSTYNLLWMWMMVAVGCVLCRTSFGFIVMPSTALDSWCSISCQMKHNMDDYNDVGWNEIPKNKLANFTRQVRKQPSLLRRTFFRHTVMSSLPLSLWCSKRYDVAFAQEHQTITLPLYPADGSAYLIYYRIDSSLFRAVLDTGSPFLTIPGSCSENTRTKTGCYNEQGIPSGFPPTVEEFAGFEGTVQWRKGFFSFYNATGSMRIASPEFVFGVVDDDIMSGTGGVYFGLIKKTDKFIRPSFLGQTDISSIVIDLRDNRPKSLTLSTFPKLLNVDFIPITNFLRKVGDPVQHFVCVVKSWFINDKLFRPKDKKPIYAIFDTGVTGMVISRDLYDQRYEEGRVLRERKLWGGEVSFIFNTSQRQHKTISAMKPLVTPFDPTWKGFKGHIVVLGLAFLDGKETTIDVDDNRLWFQ